MGWPYQQKPPMGWPLDYDSGLVPEAGFWLMNEDSGNIIQDLSGNKHNGTLHGGTWDAGETGPVISHNASTDWVDFGNSSLILPLREITIVLKQKKHDATKRGIYTFGVADTETTTRCGTHLPWSDGTVYWDFGGAIEDTTRESVAGLTDFDGIWTFTSGPRGMEIWHNGILKSSNSANPSRAASSNSFTLGKHAWLTATSDLVDFEFLSIYKRQLSTSGIAQLSQYLYWMFKDPAEVALLGGYQAVGGLSVDVSDSIVVAESVTAQLPLYVNTESESVVVSESITAQLPLYEVSVSESVVVVESLTAQLPLYEVSESESVVVAESVTAQLPLYEASLSDSVVVSESVTAQFPLYEVSVSDSVVVSESITAMLPLYEVVEYESVVVSENVIAGHSHLEVSVSDSVVVGEAVTAFLFSTLVGIPIISSQGVIHDKIFSGVIVRGHNK